MKTDTPQHEIPPPASNGAPTLGKSSHHWPSQTPSSEELKFLEGPAPRGTELWRALRIFAECIKGFRAFHFVGPCVTVYGSARFDPSHRYYMLAREVGAGLARAGFTVMTGGGPGIMEAANRGAKEVGGHSVGCNIQLPKEQDPNPYLDRWVEFRYFFVRKVMLAKYSYAFIAMPGGFGTMDELFEIATLLQTGKMKAFPIVLMGVEYWTPLIDFLRLTMLAQKTIDAEDVDRFFLTDSPQAAVDHIKSIAMDKFGLKYRAPLKPHKWLLGENGWGKRNGQS